MTIIHRTLEQIAEQERQWKYQREQLDALNPDFNRVEYVHQPAFEREFKKIAKYRYGLGF